MKVFIKVEDRIGLLIDASKDCGALFSVLATGILIQRESWKSPEWRQMDKENLKIEIVPDDFASLRTPIHEQMIKDMESNQRQWLTEYDSHQKTKAELEALQAKIAKAGIKFDEPQPQTPPPGI